MGEQRFTQICKKKKKAHGVMAPVITPGLVAMPWAALPIINSLSFGGRLLQFLFFSGSQASDFHVFTAKKDFTFAPASAAPLELQLQEGIASTGTANTHKVQPLQAASPGSHCKPTPKQTLPTKCLTPSAVSPHPYGAARWEECPGVTYMGVHLIRTKSYRVGDGGIPAFWRPRTALLYS